MYFSSVIFSIFNIFVIFGAPSNYDRFEQRLIDLGKQLDRVELQLNNSFNQLLEKFNESNQDVIRLIKTIHRSKSNKYRQSSNRPVIALFIIDVQNDFINGTLALRNCPSKHNGEEVVPIINQLLNSIDFDVVVYSHDWHPKNHISFFDNLQFRSKLLSPDSIPLEELQLYSTATFTINNLTNMQQTLWPRHCVQNSFGAQLHPDLTVLNETNTNNATIIHIYKGTKPDIDSYSAFWDNMKLSETKLHQALKENNVTHVFLTGLATDWCVYSTGMHALEYGYQTFIIEDACRGVDEKTIKKNLEIFIDKDGYVIQSNQIKDYIQ